MLRLLPRLLTLAACAVACRASTVPPSTPLAPLPTPRPSPDVAQLASSPVACGLADVSPPSQTCAPKMLAQTPGKLVARVWETSCPVYDLRNDGALEVSNGEHYSIGGEPTTVRPASRRRGEATVAGSQLVEVQFQPGSTQLVFESGTRCEALPMAMEPRALGGRSDGHLVYWGRDAAGELHHLERTVDARWIVSPPLPSGTRIYVDIWEMGGRVVSSYRSTTLGPDSEVGYYDPETNQLRPIRRGADLTSLQLVPGAAPSEPPTALYTAAGSVFVDQPDVDAGYRRISRKLVQQACPQTRYEAGGRTPTGNFHSEANPVLVRTMAGGLWLVYTDIAGRCDYQLAGGPGSGRPDPFLLARPPPRPPVWQPTPHVTRAQLVAVPIEGGAFGSPKRAPLPLRELDYAGPWQFHPSVTASLIRIVIGAVAIDLDPAQLVSRAPLVRPWQRPEPVRPPVVTRIATPPPANAAPFPSLRIGALAQPLAVTAAPPRTIVTPLTAGSSITSTCGVTTRVASNPRAVDRQLVLRCDLARALAMATTGPRVAFTQFSQRGYEPLVELDDADNVVVRLQPDRAHITALRFEKGALVLGPQLPPRAPPVPPGFTFHGSDATSVLATSHDRGYALSRGTVDLTNPNMPVWSWNPAFGTTRTPPSGPMFWPVVVRHAKGDPTIVYVADPRVSAEIVVRTPAGAYVPLQAWGRGVPSSYRVHELAAALVPGLALPVVAAKVDTSLVLAYPSSPTTYAMRAVVGIEHFEAMPAAPAKPLNGKHCAQAIVEREREEVYSPQLFAWDQGAGLAYLSTRVLERLRWTKIAPDCGWVVDGRTIVNELVVSRVGERGATELTRVPVEYRGGTGFHGSNLLVERQGTMLHTIATSVGLTTYTRVRLGP